MARNPASEASHLHKLLFEHGSNWRPVKRIHRLIQKADYRLRGQRRQQWTLLTVCLNSRCRCLYLAVILALNTGMRYSETRLLRWRQVDFAGKILTIGKSKSPTGSGRANPLNPRILGVLEMWTAQFPG